MSMKIVVTELPEEPKDCLFSEPIKGQLDKAYDAMNDDYSDIKYRCTLRPHVDEYTAIKHALGKPANILCNCKTCDLLQLSNHWSDE